MSSTDRQSRLLATEDWKAIYQSFRNADFQSYDFDNLRRTMINYLRENYPEDFNDYIESSEYLALIDLIAFLGQNLSFRIDLNARENFLETAERRESVLRLARLISYNPTRNLAANGLLKIDTIKTTEDIRDSAGLNLSGSTIRWNDKSNPNYYEQFLKVLNSALPVNGSFGRPIKSEFISDIFTEQYRFNALNTDKPIFKFNKTVEGIDTQFEIVSTAIENSEIVEEPPLPGNNPSFLFRDDGNGPGSSNTGFFMHFRQGKMEEGSFSISNPTPNQTVAIDTTNINNSDVWLYSVDGNGFESQLWSKLDNVEGNNIIYNSLFRGARNVYTVTTRVDDRINLVFSDGVFGNLPSGNFKIYYRVSDNSNSVITPSALNNIQISFPYISKNNLKETMTLGLSLKGTVTNGSASESTESIKQNAPATYYTQNRLITGEDYNIGPLGINQNIIKTKSVNRISSGISRYYDLRDPSGKYSNTNVFADDGVIYKEEYFRKTSFSFTTESDIEGVIYNTVEPILADQNMLNFYYQNFGKILTTDLSATWNVSTTETNEVSGYLTDIDGNAFTTGSATSNILRFIEDGSLLKFIAPDGYHFMENGDLMFGVPDHKGATRYKWVKVTKIFGNGDKVIADGTGPITINDNIANGAILNQIIPKLSRTLTTDLITQIIDRTILYRDFALRYSREDRTWKLITQTNINTNDSFSQGKAGDESNNNLDSSWLLYFKTDGEKYTITYRNLRYVFESKDEIRFFFDNADKIYDTKTGRILKDRIDILNINTKPDSLEPLTLDYSWAITDAYRDAEGYLDTRKVQIQFFDDDDDGVIDNPESFADIVDETVRPNNKIIFQKKYKTTDGVEDYRYFDNYGREILVFQNQNSLGATSRFEDNQVFYFVDEKVFKILNKTLSNLTITTDYKAFVGRDDLKFRYLHVADSNYRIDPASSNIIDTYILEKNYDIQFRKFLSGEISKQPLPASQDQLFRSYGQSINSIKSISDEIVYHPVKYKMLFGQKAAKNLQVTFKIVKNPGLTINNNSLKSEVISAINRFFSLEFWSFGDTFYFQELSAYIMNSLSPELVSVVIVPNQTDQSFGSLFEIKSESDEIFINAATVEDIEIIDQMTASNLQASGSVVTSVSTSSQGSIASTTTNTSSSSSSGGYSY